MITPRKLTAISLIGICACLPNLVYAKVSEQEAQKLKNELNPVGGERAGNADGSIPPWTGKYRGLPEGLNYSGSGDVYPDPYANEKPLFTITAENMSQYEDKLNTGLKAMFAKYPDTFAMPIYTSHRDFRDSQLMEDRTWFCALNTELTNGVDGLKNYTGGAPFPIPKSGAEVLWNGRIFQPAPVQDAVMDDIAVFSNGRRNAQTQEIKSDFPFSYKENPIGMVDDEISIQSVYVYVDQTAPAREKGKLTILQDPVDAVKTSRNTWVYMPGSRRVRRAPTVGYDTPQGPGGLLTIDDTMGFNGAMDRYHWKLIEKKEMYIPYHNYKFDDPTVKYTELLPTGHANPDYMRYELHRVWVVEATLKDGARHIYGKRRFYIDEDSWQISLVESYDGRNELWRVVILQTLYDYFLEGYIARSAIYHDLQSGAYIANRMVNEQRPTNYGVTPLGKKFFTPQNLRKLGRR